MFKIVLFLIFSFSLHAKEIKFLNSEQIDLKESLKTVERVLNLFEIYNLKDNINIELKKSIINESKYNKNSNHILITYTSKIDQKILAHELTHFLIYNYFSKNKIIKSSLMEETIADLIGFEFNNYEGVCESKRNKLNYKISYNKKDKNKFNQYYFIKEALECCEISHSLFCQELSNKTQYYSLEYIAKNNKNKEYPFTKDYIDNHYIGLPIVSYIKENNIKTKDFINKIKKSKEEDTYSFLKSHYYNLNLWKKYHLNFIKQ